MKSVVNGSGLNDSIAGAKQEFSVYLYDVYQYPSPVEADIVQVQILRENDSYSVSPFIYHLLNKNGIFYDQLFYCIPLYNFDNCILIVLCGSWYQVAVQLQE